MKRPRRRNPLAVALYLNAALLLTILAALLARDPNLPMLPMAMGQAQPSNIAGGGGLYVMPAQFSGNVWGCYLMDVEQQTLCAYTVSGSPPQMKLVASRDFRYDRHLRNFNTNPSPQEVQDLIAKEASSSRVTDRPPPQPVSPEQPPQSR